MKKVTINFIMSMAVVALMLVCIVILGVASAKISDGCNSAKNEISATRQKDEIGDVEGYGIAVNGIGYGFGALTGFVILVIEILIGGYALLLFVFAAIARAVFSKQGKGLIAYRVLMGIEYVLQGGLVLFCIKVMSVPLMILAALVAAAIVYGSINTYTDRILD